MKTINIKQIVISTMLITGVASLTHVHATPIQTTHETRTLNHLADDKAITNLVNGWMYRDTAQWEKLQSIFAPEATIEVTWFEGKATDFINASKKMGTSKLATKHLIGTPVVNYHGDKALAETNVMIIVHNDSIKLGSTVHARFYDQIQKINNIWKIKRRQVFYDFGSFDYPAGVVPIDQTIVDKFPMAYAPLGYLLNSAGYPVNRVFATKNSDAEKQIRQQAQLWLND